MTKDSERHFLYRWLCYITNNEENPKHEIQFDIAFFIINTITLIFGITFLVLKHQPEWTAILIIEYTWALDTLRHNRN